MPDMDIETQIFTIGGVAHSSTLRRAGITSDSVERAAKRGDIVRVRRGIYASPRAHGDVIRAARVGGRLAGASAGRIHGLWVPPDQALVVEVGAAASHLRDPDDAAKRLDLTRDDVKILWARERRTLAQALGVASLAECIGQVAISETSPLATAIIDSAIRRTPISRFDLAEIQARVPMTVGRCFELASSIPESGTESVLYAAMVKEGLAPRLQVPVPLTDLDRLDFLVGDRLVIECDSEEFHGRPGQRLRDLQRDAQLAALGLIVLRFDYRQVFYDLESVMAAIRTYIQLGLHLTSSRFAAADGVPQ